jgi:UDP-N-acetylglucosamine acyltransferase
MEASDHDNLIHPSAVLEGEIKMGRGNRIGPNVVLKGNIIMGDHNIIDCGVFMENNVRMGNQNHLYPYVVIGSVAEMGAKGDRFIPEGWVSIHNEVTIREFVCINSPFYFPETLINDKVYVMNKCYIAHDCVIGRGAILSAGVLLGGRCVIGEHSNLGLGATVHQRIHVGDRVMVGMQSVVTKDIVPYSLIAGNPARILRFNRIGAERNGIEEKEIEQMERLFKEGLKEMAGVESDIAQEINVFLKDHPTSLLELKVK